MKKLIKWIINDIKTDIKFLKSVSNGTYKLPKNLREELKHTTPKKIILDILNDKWFWIAVLIFLLAFGSGYVWGDVINNNRCVNYINTNMIPLLRKANVPNLENLNFTMPFNGT